MNQDQETFWSKFSLKKKIDLWSTDQIRNFFIPLLNLKANEQIYDIGSGYSPLGIQFLPFIMPNGHITGFDNSKSQVEASNDFVNNKQLSKYISFAQGNVYEIDEKNLPLVDLVMCQQLLVNVPDPVTALEHMLNLLNSTGRIFCVENINYGAYVYRPDFSWRTNLKLTRIWQQLCVIGKFRFDHGDSTFGANLPQIFHEFGLQDIQWQIISPGVNAKPPYSEEFKKAFLKNYDYEKNRIKDLILHSWGPKTKLKESQINFFVDQLITSDYDQYAVENDLFLTQWYYPLIAIVGWIKKREKIDYSETVELKI